MHRTCCKAAPGTAKCKALGDATHCHGAVLEEQLAAVEDHLLASNVATSCAAWPSLRSDIMPVATSRLCAACRYSTLPLKALTHVLNSPFAV